MENTNILGRNINTNILKISEKEQEFDYELLQKL
jgi:hypothetical protein